MGANEAAAQHLDTLVKKLVPLLHVALKENVSGKSPTACECKCAKHLSALQKSYERLSSSVQGYKDHVDTWKTKVKTLQNDVYIVNAERSKEANLVKSSAIQMNELHDKLTNRIDLYTKTHNNTNILKVYVN